MVTAFVLSYETSRHSERGCPVKDILKLHGKGNLRMVRRRDGSVAAHAEDLDREAVQ